MERQFLVGVAAMKMVYWDVESLPFLILVKQIEFVFGKRCEVTLNN